MKIYIISFGPTGTISNDYFISSLYIVKSLLNLGSRVSTFEFSENEITINENENILKKQLSPIRSNYLNHWEKLIRNPILIVSFINLLDIFRQG
jgi:hypothetical protein